MTPHDAEVFATLMEMLNRAFQRQPLAKETQTRVYFPALADLSIDQVRAAVERAIREEEFMPTPATLRRLALGTVEQRAAFAWARVKRAALAGYGGYQPLNFNDPALHAAVVGMGGWSQLYSLGFRDTESVDWATARKEFMALYAGYLTIGVPGDTPKKLAAASPRADRDDAAVEVPLALSGIAKTPAAALPAATTRPVDFAANQAGVKELLADVTSRLTLGEVRYADGPARHLLRARGRTEIPRPPTAAEEAEHAERKRVAIEQLQRGSRS